MSSRWREPFLTFADIYGIVHMSGIDDKNILSTSGKWVTCRRTACRDADGYFTVPGVEEKLQLQDPCVYPVTCISCLATVFHEG